jgi:hypothetical protein
MNGSTNLVILRPQAEDSILKKSEFKAPETIRLWFTSVNGMQVDDDLPCDWRAPAQASSCPRQFDQQVWANIYSQEANGTPMQLV